MKTKVLVFLVLSAIATLSFTVVSVKNSNNKQAKEVTKTQPSEAPIGGLGSDDKL